MFCFCCICFLERVQWVCDIHWESTLLWITTTFLSISCKQAPFQNKSHRAISRPLSCTITNNGVGAVEMLANGTLDLFILVCVISKQNLSSFIQSCPESNSDLITFRINQTTKANFVCSVPLYCGTIYRQFPPEVLGSKCAVPHALMKRARKQALRRQQCIKWITNQSARHNRAQKNFRSKGLNNWRTAQK